MITKRIKQEFKGLIIIRNNYITGNIILDTTKITPEEFDYFEKNGFPDVFETLELCDNCLQIECECKALTDADSVADLVGEPRPDFNKSSLDIAHEEVKEYTKPQKNKKNK